MKFWPERAPDAFNGVWAFKLDRHMGVYKIPLGNPTNEEIPDVKAKHAIQPYELLEQAPSH